MSDRSTASRLIGVAIAIAGLALAGAATANALGNSAQALAPGVALALPVGDQLRLRALDQTFLVQQRRFQNPEEARAVALKALSGEPLTPRAVRVLAFADDPQARSKEALALAELAHRMSRREDLTEIVLMDAAVRRRDAKAAINHFDIFLRANPEGQTSVFPLLTRALADRTLQRELTHHFVERSPWMSDFISYASSTGQQPGLATDIVLAAGKRANEDDLELLGPMLLTRLVEAREFRRAYQLLGLVGGDPRAVAVPGLTSASTDRKYGLLAWQPVSEGNRSGDITRSGNGGTRNLSIYGGPGATGVVARKIVTLPAGPHTLTQQVTAQLYGQEEVARWQMRCATSADNAPFWTGPRIAITGERLTKQAFRVPAGCAYQELALWIDSSTRGPGIDMVIGNFAID